jgi:hypothetical protein
MSIVDDVGRDLSPSSPVGKDLGCLKGGYCAKQGAPGFSCRPSNPGACEFLC